MNIKEKSTFLAHKQDSSVSLGKEIICFNLQLAFLSRSEDKWGFVRLTSFEIFGKIFDLNRALQNMIFNVNDSKLHSPSIFEYLRENYCGLFNRFIDLSMKSRQEILVIQKYDSKEQTPIENLLEWNTKFCISSSFRITLSFSWVYRPFGCRWRSGKGKHLTCWKFHRINSSHGKKNLSRSP
jgi:hypothetical protein